jgi:hypothetical protein
MLKTIFLLSSPRVILNQKLVDWLQISKALPKFRDMHTVEFFFYRFA